MEFGLHYYMFNNVCQITGCSGALTTVRSFCIAFSPFTSTLLKCIKQKPGVNKDNFTWMAREAERQQYLYLESVVALF